MIRNESVSLVLAILYYYVTKRLQERYKRYLKAGKNR